MTQDPNEEAQDVTPAAKGRDVEEVLRHVERVLYMRIGAGMVLYVIFAILDISAALTHTMQERAPLLIGLLIAAIFALPRQVFKRELLQEIQGEVKQDWIARMKRIQTWLVWVRAVFFLGALFLFLGLPEIV